MKTEDDYGDDEVTIVEASVGEGGVLSAIISGRGMDDGPHNAIPQHVVEDFAVLNTSMGICVNEHIMALVKFEFSVRCTSDACAHEQSLNKLSIHLPVTTLERLVGAVPVFIERAYNGDNGPLPVSQIDDWS